MTPNFNAKWTPEQDELIVKLWRDNYSATDIALQPELRGYSRNAVIGRLTRLREKQKRRGIEVTVLHSRKRGQHTEAPRKRKKRTRVNWSPKRAARAAAMAPTPVAVVPLPENWVGKPLLALGSKDCRFIISPHRSREFLYCAADASAIADECGNNCYCPYHFRIMHAAAR